jgi:hypothetical protein
MKILNHKGNVLLFAIVAFTFISVLGTGIYFMTTSAIFSGLGANQQNKAYQLAVAGRDYALAKNLGNMDRYFTMDNGDKFRLEITGDTINSTGIVSVGTPFEARRTITVTKTGFGSQADISFAKDIAAIDIIQPTSAPSDFISKTATDISLGKVGAAYGSKFGAALYGGNSAGGNCVDGECDFGTGFNAFFIFQFAAGSTGDGFTFTFFNGDNNSSSSVGGSAGQGELMGYAGDSYVSLGYYLDGQGGRGIQPPKVAVEFDPYINACSAECGSNSRCDEEDPSPNIKNHMALMFWGDDTPFCGATVGKNTFDDNRHGDGGGSNVSFVNARNPTQSFFNQCRYFDGNDACTGPAYLWPGNWLLNTALPNIYLMRMEVRRKLTPEVSGNYQYAIKTWIKRCAANDPSCPEYAETSDYADTKTEYTPGAPDHTIERTIEMSPGYHSRFNKMIFGWTTATGGATQRVDIRRFRINFLK